MKKQSGNKKGGSLKKILIACMIVLGVGCGAWLAFLLFGNNYKSNAMQMKVNTIVASRMANIMLGDYLNNWVRAETEQLGINAKGELAGEFAFGGSGAQAKLLEAEGVEVIDGRVDLKKYQWKNR